MPRDVLLNQESVEETHWRHMVVVMGMKYVETVRSWSVVQWEFIGGTRAAELARDGKDHEP